jgi:GNAT superfamily N-acetyltransferase
MAAAVATVTADLLAAHLRAWVGGWPPPRPGITVVGDPARSQPTWDGRIRPLMGVGDGVGVVLGVAPEHVEAVRRVVGSDIADPELGDRLAAVLGMRPSVLGTGVFRWTHLPSPLEPAGTWVEPPGDPRLPAWLAPFNGRRLVAFDARGAVLAGIGIKVHDAVGQELAVVTERAARGKGLARRLVVTAARRVLAEGGLPTYLHDPANTASARVADAAGFPDRGWTVHGLWPRS